MTGWVYRGFKFSAADFTAWSLALTMARVFVWVTRRAAITLAASAHDSFASGNTLVNTRYATKQWFLVNVVFVFIKELMGMGVYATTTGHLFY